ncbi:M14 family zinc carboxypeptidase [Actinophytocola sp.]|uniref:M14 family zinc carboxypeptidase n=1 Tax=Actinophytocola sp. TaxID=1872138 RepID=UPI0025C64E80|nr:M14 family zinc carboxypeptidase [Actinophytocola sp.]
MLDQLLASGADVATSGRTPDGKLIADLVLTGTQLDGLVAKGAEPLQLIQREQDGTARYAQSVQAAKSRVGAAQRAAADTLQFLSAYWWTTDGRTFLETRVATTAVFDPEVEITVGWRTADGTTGSFPLQRFEDAGEYQYHIASPQPVPAKPVQVTATSSLGGVSRTITPTLWPGATPPELPEGYQHDFVDAYMTPVDIKARVARLARQYRDLVDVVDLPNKTQGYRRTATTYVGDPAIAAVVVESVQYGDQGPNGWQVRTVDPGKPNRPARATWRDRVLTVSLATDRDGAVISTTDQVAALIGARFPQRFTAFVEDGSAGKVMPVAGPARMSDGLDAPAGVPHKPWTVQALRIGAHRDGSRIGVLAYSQEHAREWATPLVTLEFAERLLANYATDEETRQLLEDVEVFVIPTVNPDGANYSFNDANFQRKNMSNHCTGAQRDPRFADSWGVDVNRNYTVGSVFDGYVGASTTNCLSGTYAGTAELSEAEANNVVDLAAAHPNIRFGMNVHSYGGYFMWPPGAYAMPGRITLPRPSTEESTLFQASAKRIVGAIAGGRSTVTWPSRTGPVADVLYSAAGNSADQLYYELGIYAWDFEIGNDRWNAATGEWEGMGFQPPFPEAHAESQEYADGLLELVRVARDHEELLNQ